jgi:hypothetical protein
MRDWQRYMEMMTLLCSIRMLKNKYDQGFKKGERVELSTQVIHQFLVTLLGWLLKKQSNYDKRSQKQILYCSLYSTF